MKRIILEYFSFLLFESFNGGNGKSIPLFGRVGRNGMDREKHLFLSIYLKSQIFILPKLRRMGENKIRLNDFFTKIPKIPPIYSTIYFKIEV